MNKPSTVAVGNRAERAAAAHLKQLGYTIIELNYRRKSCEIDIVALMDDTVYFVEVKYRGSDGNGNGLDYIGAAKLRHMQRAAAVWVAEHNWSGEYTLAAIEVGGPNYAVLTFVESIW